MVVVEEEKKLLNTLEGRKDKQRDMILRHNLLNAIFAFNYFFQLFFYSKNERKTPSKKLLPLSKAAVTAAAAKREKF